jgi:hypothetical protein
MDLEDTIKAIAKLGKVYKDKIKKPNMFNANIQDIFGYDSVIDINGTRASDLLGVAIIKGLDKTLVDLAKDETIDNLSVVEYLKNADNKDEARKRVIEKVKVNTPNIIDPVLINSLQVIKEEKLAIDPDNVFVSDMAASELNAEFGTLEDEIINFNEIEEVKEEEKTSNVIQEAVSSVDAGTKSVEDLFSNQYIQPEIPFGSINLEPAVEENVTTNEPSDELKVENPTVTVVEPLEKTSELQELSEPKLDTIDENVQPVYTGDENKVTEDFVLPGEEDFVEPQPVVEEPIETVATETVEPKDVVPIVAPSAASVDVNPTIENTEVPESKGTETVLTNMDYIKTLEEPYKNSFNVSENVEVPVAETTEAVETPVVEEAVGVPVEDTSEVEVQQAADTSMITEPVVHAEEPVVQDDTQVDLEKTQILQPVEVVSPVEAPKPELPSGIKEIITPQVNPVPEFKPEEHVEAPVQPVVEPAQPLEAEAQELKNEVEQQLNTLQNAEVDTRTIEIPTEEIKEEGSDILSAISSNLEVPDSSKLSTEEKIAVVADTFTKPVDPVRQAKIDKYNGIFLDNQVLDFQVRDTNSEIIMKEDGTPYTFLDYLENNDVLSKIQLDSKYYIKDDPSRDYVDGKTFIREFVIPNSVNGNRSIEDILDWYVKSVTNINEQPKKKGFFSFGRK